MDTALAHFEDKLEEVVKDLEGQDEYFYHDSHMRTIYWWAGRMKTIAFATAEIRDGAARHEFVTEVSKRYRKMSERRIYEGLEVYQRFYKQGDSLKETCERIFQETGGWSKALPAKSVEQTNCQHAWKCERCGEHK